MKAIVYKNYGSPDVLHLKEVEKPAAQAGKIMVKVHAAAVNPQDWHLMRADPFLVRLMAGILKPKNQILGSDMSGQVEAVGSNVVQFHPGDKVYGELGLYGLGGFAEYVTVPEKALAKKPANLTFEEAAALPSASCTALQALRDQGHIQAGQKVLINGASGGVGTIAVQLAKSFGAEVTGVCSTRNTQMVGELGADHVIDYTLGDFTQNGRQYDLIIDNVGNPAVYKRLFKLALAPTGICVVVAGSFFLQLVLGPWMSKSGQKRIGTYMTHPNQADLKYLTDLVETGKVKPVIDRGYSLKEVPEAIRYLETGRARGKVVIKIAA